MKLLRLAGPDGVCARLGFRPTTVYARVGDGTLPPPVKLGRNSVWPDLEIEAVIGAIISGHTEDEIRALVATLVAQRSAVPPTARGARHPLAA